MMANSQRCAERRERAEWGVRGPRERVSLAGCVGSPPSKEEAQREMDDLTNADFMSYKDDGE